MPSSTADMKEVGDRLGMIAAESIPRDCRYVLLIFPQGGHHLGTYHSNADRDEAVRKMRASAQIVSTHTGSGNGNPRILLP